MARKKQTGSAEPGQDAQKRTKPVSYDEWSKAKDEFEPSLPDSISYKGQFKAARTMLVNLGTYTSEAIAGMTDDDVLRCIQMDWKVVAVENEEILLVRRDRLAEFAGMSYWLSR